MSKAECTGVGEAEIAWVDVETTGLEVSEGHQVLQVAAILTDKRFNEIDSFERVVFFDKVDSTLLRERVANDYVRAMHDKTGLWGRLPDGVPVKQVDEELHAWLVTHQPKENFLYFGGNSQVLDREFMKEFTPQALAHLSYRDLNMTSVEKFFNLIEERPNYTKKRTHDAMDDIRESIESARYHWRMNTPF